MGSLETAKRAKQKLDEATDTNQVLYGIGLALLTIAEVLWEKLK